MWLRCAIHWAYWLPVVLLFKYLLSMLFLTYSAYEDWIIPWHTLDILILCHIRRKNICYTEFTFKTIILKLSFVNDNNGLTISEKLMQVFLIHQDHTFHFSHFKGSSRWIGKMWALIDIFIYLVDFFFNLTHPRKRKSRKENKKPPWFMLDTFLI